MPASCDRGFVFILRAHVATSNITGVLPKEFFVSNSVPTSRPFSALGYPLREAIFQAGRRRLRPILMTALATIFGMLPPALGIGSGAEVLQPLAIAVIGGVSISMILSLLVTPVLFYLLKQRRLQPGPQQELPRSL
jgi:Cu/Ag efflux pump CusA